MSDATREEMLLELDIPDGVPEAEQAVELIRAWIADGSLVVALNGEAFGDDMKDWGRLLAEIGRHVAHASSLEGDVEEDDALAEIRKSFESAMTLNGETVSARMRGRTTH
jgi:hypothetical protein